MMNNSLQPRKQAAVLTGFCALFLLVTLNAGCLSRRAPVRQFALPGYLGSRNAGWLELSMPEYLQNRNFVQYDSFTGELRTVGAVMWAVPFNRMVESALAYQLDSWRSSAKGADIAVELHNFAVGFDGKFHAAGRICRRGSGISHAPVDFSFELESEEVNEPLEVQIVWLCDYAVEILAETVMEKVQ